MGVYQITYAPTVKQFCLYFDEGCDFRCHGCISRFHLESCYFYGKVIKRTYKKSLPLKETLALISPFFFKSVILLGQEPTKDSIFQPLVKILKKRFSSHNAVITNCWRYIEDSIDEVCGSIKAITPQIFKEFTGRDSPDRVLKNFEKYADNDHIKLRAETIFVPGLIDKEEIQKIATFIASIDPQIPYRIDAYIPISAYFPKKKDRFREPTQKEMNEAKLTAGKYLKNVSVLTRGIKPKFEVKKVY